VKKIRLSALPGRADSIQVTARTALAAALVLAASALAFAAEGKAFVQPKTAGRVIESLPLHLAMAGMKASSAPYVVDGELVLSVAGPFRSVSAAFAHEGFAILHPYERNRQGVFVLAYPVPLKRSDPLEYRIVVDGAWTVDPADPERRSDPATGLELSVAKVPYLSDLRLGSYKLLAEDGRTARFIFRGEAGEYVTVCGDFDNWDPFIHEMAETSPGVYQLDLVLAPGRHYYTYYYRGETLSDPLNPDKARSGEGKTVSVLSVAP
jgi:hypothetical protein